MRYKEYVLPKRISDEVGKVLSSKNCLKAAHAKIRFGLNCPRPLACELTPHNENSIREQVKTYYSAVPALESLLLDEDQALMLRNESLFQSFTIALSELAITEYYKDFAVCFGEPSFLLAMLVDPRQSVSSAAFEHIKKFPDENPWQKDSLDDAADNISVQFGTFLQNLRGNILDKIPKKGADNGISVGGLIHSSGAARIEELKTQLHKVREDLEAERKAKKKDRSEFEAKLAAAGKKIAAAEAESRHLAHSQAKAALAGAEAELGRLITQCFSVPEQKAPCADEATEAKLQALNKVLDHAQYFKLRLEAVGCSVPRALTDAITFIYQEIEELKRRRDTAHELKELKSVLRKLQDICSSTRLIAGTEANLSHTELELLKKIGDALLGRGSGGSTLGMLFRERRPATVLIDGDNLLNFIYTQVAFASRETLSDGRAAIPYQYRNRLIGELRNTINLLAKQNRSARITLYHDRAGVLQREKYGDIDVVWSGGEAGERDKADKVMLSDLRSGYYGEEKNLFLVTDDRAIIRNSRAFLPDINSMSPDDFRAFIFTSLSKDMVAAFKEIISSLKIK